MENIACKVQHSKTTSQWNVVGTKLGAKYKLARVPYHNHEDDIIATREKAEALEIATFICMCLNNAKRISE